MPNLLQILLLEYLDARWDHHKLWENPNITIKYVEKYYCFFIDNSYYFLNWFGIPPKPFSYEATAKWEDIYNNKLNVLEWYTISTNPNITWEIVKANPNIKWNYSGLSKNINITPKIVADNPNIKWDKRMLCENPNMQWKHLKNNYKSFEDSDYVKQYMCLSLKENPNITWEIYNKHLKLPSIEGYEFIYKTYCINPNITYENIKHMELTDADFRVLSRNKFKYSTDLQHVWQKRLTCACNKLKKQMLQRMLRYKICIPRHFM